VRFQNTGTDTAFAVVIRDTLESDLDLMSLEILGASHAFIPSFGEGRELIFTFNDILLPDSTTDLLGSQGFVAFRLKPRSGLLPGDVIENMAGIYFDFNPPIITEPSVLVAETSTGIAAVTEDGSRVWPNPANDQVRIAMNEPIATIELLSMDGRTVQRFPSSGNEWLFATEGYAAGCYLLAITTRNGRVAHRTLTIQH
jgi:hypothetical protein